MTNLSTQRHKGILMALEKAWQIHPEIPLGQLLASVAKADEKPLSVLHLSDQEMLNRLNFLQGKDGYIVPVWGSLFHALGFSEFESAELEGENTENGKNSTLSLRHVTAKDS